MKKLASFLLLSTLFTSTFVFAAEPTNIAITKQKLQQYYNSGTYDKDVISVMNKAQQYLELRVKKDKFDGKPAIVLDIDETSLSNYPDMVNRDFGGTMKEIQQDEDKGTDLAIDPTLKLYRYAKEHGVAVFFVTGRFENERQVTEENLTKAGFTNFDGLVLRDTQNEKTPASVYKTAIRKQLTEKGFDIILNIGDQHSDLRGGFSDKVFKLPNPYYFIP